MTYYDLLGLPKTATPSDIKKAWREASMKWHPDKLPADKKEEGEKMFKSITEAYDILKNPEKRAIYDEQGMEGLNPTNQGGQDMSDILNAMLNRQQKTDVPPVQVGVDIVLEDAYMGKTMDVEIERMSLCKDCNHTGFADKINHNCSTCEGVGFITRIFQIGPGMMQQIRQPCDKCKGVGNDSSNSAKCAACKGKCIAPEITKISVPIEKGVSSGDIIEIKNQGHDIHKSGELKDKKGKRGNVLVVIKEIEHDIFKRNKNPTNLYFDMKISLAEALCGFSREITHLDGRKIYVDVHDMINNGDVKMITGEGMPQRGKFYKVGNLYVKFIIELPNKFTNDVHGKLYKLLTGKQYHAKTVHNIPADVEPVELQDVSNGETNENEDSDGDDDENGNIPHGFPHGFPPGFPPGFRPSGHQGHPGGQVNGCAQQ